MALDEKDRNEIKDIIIGSLEESGLTDAAGKINQPQRMTKEEIMAVKSRTKRQQLIRENMDLFR